MIQKTKLLGAVAGITFAGALAASAATFSTIGGSEVSFPTAGTGSGDYTLSQPSPLPSTITVYTTDGGEGVNMEGLGLTLSKKSRLVFTYLGADANFRNKSFGVGGIPLFDTKFASVGDKVAVDSLAGLVSLLFTTDGGFRFPDGSIANGTGTGTPRLSLGFSISADGKTAYAFFDDGGSAPGLGGNVDLDYDDLAFEISAVPVPAGGLLLLTGLGALAVARRRKQA